MSATPKRAARPSPSKPAPFVYHPCDDAAQWLQGLAGQWDTTRRLDTAARVLFKGNKTACKHLARFIINAARRALYPGCDNVNVACFYGPQGTGKSSLLQQIAGPTRHRATYNVLGASAEMFAWAWVHELPDDPQAVDAPNSPLHYLFDTLTPPYVSVPRDEPRGCVLAITTNLAPKKSRRIDPIHVAHPVNLAALVGMREQLFAEALAAINHDDERIARAGRAPRIAQPLEKGPAAQ